ncbi:MAG: lipopolysaccharide heptosyltransferase II [Blastocatellia bacterium]|nr:lipopolysaccharide heptosyltransferase II [Blastocatellia bacterium]
MAESPRLKRLMIVEKILVRGTNWVGDSIVTIPALRELKRIFPEAKLSLLVKPWVSGIFEDADFIDELIIYERDRKGLVATIRELYQKQFSLAVLFQNAFEAAFLAFGARAKLRMGFPTQHRSILLTHSLKLTQEILKLHQIYYYLHIVSQVEEKLFGQSRVDFDNLSYKLPVSFKRQEAIRERLLSFGIDPAKRAVAINPGATNSRAKRWPAERFGALADKLIDVGFEVVFIGAGNELDITQAAVATMRQKAKILTGKTSLSESIAFLSICDLLISNDTGPAYIASAIDRPTLTIFGPTNEQMIRPFGKNAQMIRHKVDCAPCMLRECPIDHRCMTGISVDMVMSYALSMLKRL